MEIFSTTVVHLQDPVLDQFLGKNISLYSTLEGENPGGSVKDHMVLGTLGRLQSEGGLRPDAIVTEASAGSTALSLAHYTHLKKIRCTLFVPDNHPKEALDRLRALGADVRLVDLDADWSEFYTFCKNPGVIAFNQHLDESKRVYYQELGKRVIGHTGPLDAVIGAVGTGHSLIGASEGMGCKPYRVSAEPRTVKVSGIRNIDTLRYGENDPCRIELFDERILLDASEFFPISTLMTNLGRIHFPDSFRVALGGLRRLAESRPQIRSCFVLGSTNRRQSAA